MGLFLLQVFLTALHFVLEFTLFDKEPNPEDLAIIAHEQFKRVSTERDMKH